METLLHKMLKIYGDKIKGILHVGACLCEEIELYESYMPRNKILWIEALNDKVELNKQKHSNLLIENAVVSDIIEIVTFKRANWDSASSCLELGLCNHLYPEIYYTETYQVETRLLKNILCNYNILFNFINLDIQGYELKALKGMESYLEKVDYILTEVSSNFLYKNQCTLKDLDEYLIEFGFYRVETIKIKEHELMWWGEAFYVKNNTLLNHFVDYSINNAKGNNFEERFIDILSDPNNFFIKRNIDAGKIEDNCVIMHNGIKVIKDGYYGSFSNILVQNKGCHEPAEERMFDLVLKYIPKNAVMIELGSYWAFYTIWFNKIIENAKNYCIEPELDNINLGKKNCEINNVTADFTQGFIGKNYINVYDFIKNKHIDYIDLLHSDIQGYEFEMLEGIKELLLQNKIGYLFISTHSEELHTNCTNFLENNNYRIIASANYDTETFCMDGIIVACQKNNLLIPKTYLGNRKYTKLRTTPYDNL